MMAPGDGVVFQEGGGVLTSFPPLVPHMDLWNGVKICNAQQIFVYGFKSRSNLNISELFRTQSTKNVFRL